MNKIQLQPGDILLSIGTGFLTFLVQILTWPLVRKRLKNIFGHVGTYMGNNTTFEASTAGVTYYKLSEWKNVKRLVVIRFDKMKTKTMQKKLIREVRKIIASHQEYGYVNYPLWWIFISPFILIPVLAIIYLIFKSMVLVYYSLSVMIILYFPITWYLRKIQRKTQVCSEAEVRLMQGRMKIDHGCDNPEAWKPNDMYQVGLIGRDANILIDFNPLKVGWLLEEYNG